MDKDAAREAEHRKYERAYEYDRYRMKNQRALEAMQDFKRLSGSTYLDVSCGRGEMLDLAEGLGYERVRGTEIVPRLIDNTRVEFAWVHELPFDDGEFNVVTLFDVIEHLIPGDDELACKELERVASKHVLLTANNKESKNKQGDELHINRRPYEEWDALFREWFTGKVTWLKRPNTVSEAWRVDL